MNKVNVVLFVPSLERTFEIAIPIDKQIYNVINLIIKILKEMTDINLIHNNFVLVNTISGSVYDPNVIVKDTDIRNGTNLMFI